MKMGGESLDILNCPHLTIALPRVADVGKVFQTSLDGFSQ